MIEAACPDNALLARLPPTERLRVLAACEPVSLGQAQELCQRGEPTREVWFPTSSFVSLLAQVDGHPSLEVGMVGREGLLGAHLLLGVDTVPLRAVVQGAGTALRMPAATFQRELLRCAALRGLVERYVYMRFAQMATAASCLRFHLIGPRLARWLLMSQDRAQAAQFHVTHAFLASMLGVRRVGVTTAAGVLQRQGVIRYHRGELVVLDRPGLERAACSCYRADCKVAELLTR